MPSAVVPTEHGDVVGHDAGGVRSWKGVPFASAARFAPAGAPAGWSYPLDAHSFGPVAPQPGPAGEVRGEEDCLTLNVWAPSSADGPLPVIVWVHGGAFVTGSGADYDGAHLAALGPAVVVTVNYRLGPLGFLHLQHLAGVLESPATPALTDLVSALRWVSANIEAFGGDPGQVTIAGQSAGAALVCSLLGVPAVRGLFRRAFAFSTTGGRNASPDEAAQVTGDLLRLLGLDETSAGRLLDVPVDALLAAGRTVELRGEVTWQAVVDGALLPSHPLDAVREGAVRDVPLWLGWCRDEMAGFSRSEPPAPLVAAVEDQVRGEVGDDGWRMLVSAYRESAREGQSPREALVTDAMWWQPAVELAEAHADAGGPAWMSRFDHTPSLPPLPCLGPSHGADNACLWARGRAFVDRPLLGRPGGPMTGVDVEVTRDLHRAVLAFVRGDPAQPGWPQYERVRRQTAVFGTPFSVVSDPDGDRRRLWDAVHGRRGAGLR